MLLPSPICKGRTARVIEFDRDVLRRVAGYRTGERQFVVARSAWEPERPLIVERLDRQGGVVNGQRRSCAALSKEERRRVVSDKGTALLWVRNDGAPMTRWSDVFGEATQRCRRLVAPDFPRVSPHTLRHTYAVHTLRQLQANIALYYRHGRAPEGWEQWFIKRRSRDPLGILQSLLGHAHRSTTAIYTDVADGSRLAVSMAEALELDAA